MNKTQKKIAELMRQNTGRNMLDSGGAYGRHFEENQKSKFEDNPDCVFDEHSITTNLYNYLSRYLKMTEDSEALQKEYEDFVKDREYTNHLEDMETFLDKIKSRLEEDNYLMIKNPRVSNTYNHECLLSQGLQYAIFMIDNKEYIILQIHNGCDVRGGYTSPYIFEIEAEEFILNLSSVSVSTKDGESYYSDDGGYRFYNNDSDERLSYEELFKKGISEVWFWWQK